METFDIPIALFLFKRIDKLILILDQISKIKPQKLYLLWDGGRTPEEQKEIRQNREIIEAKINWECDVIKRYAEENIGVYENIVGGAKWVFQHEEFAIFLEDDNFPELSFFPFCKEMLIKYRNNNRIFWVCGTNYLEKYEPEDDSSYLFTQHMMPCGWASWGEKFNKYYDGDFLLYNQNSVSRMHYNYRLKRQDISNWIYEQNLKKQGEKYHSWDYQMSFSIRIHDLYGIVPKYNQIKNIGVDLDSIHGGSSWNNVMTRRFCGLSTYEMVFPLSHPNIIFPDATFEKLTAGIITIPLLYNVKGKLLKPFVCFLKNFFGIPQTESFSLTFKKLFKMDIK